MTITFGGKKFEHGPSQILPNLYLSDAMTARWGGTLDKLGVTHIICAMEEPVTYPRTKQDIKILHIPISDEVSSDLLSYFPSAVEFISDALGTDAATGLEKQEVAELKQVANALESDCPASAPTSTPTIEVTAATPTPGDTKFQDLPMSNSNLNPNTNPKNVVLVHCLAGMSRSASVVCAYLLATTSMNTQETISFVRSRRSIIQPNYGFEKQLKAWEAKYFVATRKRRLSGKQMAADMRSRVQRYKDAAAGKKENTEEAILI